MIETEVMPAVQLFVKNKIPYVVMMSDGTEYYNGYEGSTIIWPKEGTCGTALCIRFSVEANQSENPIEMRLFGFDQINDLHAVTNNVDHVKAALTAIGRGDVEKDVLDFIDHYSDMFHTTITGSTGDGIDKWSGNIKDPRIPYELNRTV